MKHCRLSVLAVTLQLQFERDGDWIEDFWRPLSKSNGCSSSEGRCSRERDCAGVTSQASWKVGLPSVEGLQQLSGSHQTVLQHNGKLSSNCMIIITSWRTEMIFLPSSKHSLDGKRQAQGIYANLPKYSVWDSWRGAFPIQPNSNVRWLGKERNEIWKKKPTSFYPIFLNNSNSGRFKAHSYSGGIVSQWFGR